jgi:hypothetical protein
MVKSLIVFTKRNPRLNQRSGIGYSKMRFLHTGSVKKDRDNSKVHLRPIAQFRVFAFTFPCLILVLVLNITMVSGVRAQNPDWSEPVVISPEPDDHIGYSWFPEIVADLQGNVHIFWVSWRKIEQSQYGGYDTVLYCQIRDNDCEDVVELVAYDWSGGINATRPAAAVDRLNNIHLLSRGIAPWGGDPLIYYSKANANKAQLPGEWSPRRIMSATTSYYSDIATDSKGDIHIVWNQRIQPAKGQEDTFCADCSDIFYRNSRDGGKTWSAPLDISNSVMADDKPQIVIDKNDKIYVFWEEGKEPFLGKGWPTGSAMAYSSDGVTWSQPTSFIFPNDAPQRITAGIDYRGNLVVVWGLAEGYGVYFQISSDGGMSWSIPQIIPGVSARVGGDTELDDYHMASDSAGHLHLVLVGTAPDNSSRHSVFHLEWDGKAWSEPTPIFTTMGDLPEWPRIAVGNGNQLHVTWFVRDEANIWAGGGLYRIWYAHGQSQAPAKLPVIWPTLTPVYEPEVVATLTSTPIPSPTLSFTPTPTLAPDLIQVSIPKGTTDSIYTEMDDLILLIKSLAPAALVIMVVVIGFRAWRR